MKRPVVLAVLAIAAAASLTCSPGYLLRAGIEEARILGRRQSIPRLVENPATDPETRRKLDLVLQARTFALHGLGLDVGDSYTTYSDLDRDTLALVLSAARRDAFEQVTWWFPIVGSVPYKGFFSLDAANDAAERLRGEGFDTYIRPTGAFSTLGWFNDPVLSTVLRYDDVALASTVIHELTHNTLYLPSQVSFNESFAKFVGDRGAIAFFCGMEGDEGERCLTARRRWSDTLLFGQFLQDLVGRLEALYARDDIGSERKVELREQVFDDAVERFRREIEPRLLTPLYRGFPQGMPLNNASLIARRLYYDRLHLFEAAYEDAGHDLERATHHVIATAERAPEGDPFTALAAAVR